MRVTAHGILNITHPKLGVVALAVLGKGPPALVDLELGGRDRRPQAAPRHGRHGGGARGVAAVRPFLRRWEC